MEQKVNNYLETVHKKQIDLSSYESYFLPNRIDYLVNRSKDLQNFTWLAVNTSCFGGGVAETLTTALPFFRQLGINAVWNVFVAKPKFFGITKRMHDSLQGFKNQFSECELEYYREQVMAFGKNVCRDFDALEVNDFQLIPLSAVARSGVTFWRSHLDTSTPDDDLLFFYSPFLRDYDYHLFTNRDYLFPGSVVPTFQVLPTIDPIRIKNSRETQENAKSILQSEYPDIDFTGSLISSCARFDIHKNQVGVIQAFLEYKRRCKNKDAKLIIMGSSDTMDSPDEYGVLEQILQESKDCNDIYVIQNPSDAVVGSVMYLSNVFLHLARKEGFGMAITEAMWHSTPVICYATPGVISQVKEGYNGKIVYNPREASRALEEILHVTALNRILAFNAHEFVRANLLTDSFVARYIEYMRLAKGIEN